ncbi:MAG: 2-phospho-L-lactate transferase [Promethearchaeota archaeon]|nr:MAG: 2-phospho-L-lactate transferase [Candidatus Lokiarchaeota archaeon]
MLVALAGGVGAARFLEGLVRVVNPKDITVIVNTGDDLYLYGLYISPDLDTIMYNLAGIANTSTGWGIEGDTFHSLSMLERYGNDPWFKLGDKDLATHILRTHLIRRGIPLAEVTRLLCSFLEIDVNVQPMTNQKVNTRVVTEEGILDFQDYFVRHQKTAVVRDVFFEGIKDALPPQGLLETINSADGVIICPSNPIVSIQPILKVRGILPAIREKPVVAISPIVGGAPIKGPADKLMQAFNVEVSAYGVAQYYTNFLNTLVIDSVDHALQSQIEELDITTCTTNTIMRTLDDKIALAQVTLQALKNLIEQL